MPAKHTKIATPKGDPHRVYEILERLIAFPTVDGDVAAHEVCIGYAQEILEASGLHVTVHHSGGLPSLVASTQKGRKSKLILQAHVDVVPAGKQLFKLERHGDNLIGRGVFDMKFAAACFLAVTETLANQNNDLDYAIMLSCDEEIGGPNGVKYLLEQEKYEAELCLLPDGAHDWAVEEKAKGRWQVSACADGVGAHSSRPWEGENAADKLMDFLYEARRLYAVGEPHDPTLVISQLQGGTAKNQVPDKATATLDIRFLDDAIKTAVQKRLYDLAAKHDVKLTTEHLVEASHLDVNLSQVTAWKSAVKKVTGLKEVGHDISLGASDAHYFSQAGIPTIVTRPPGGCHHGPDEWIHEADLYKFYEVILDFIPRVALADKTSK